MKNAFAAAIKYNVMIIKDMPTQFLARSGRRIRLKFNI